MRTTRIPTSPPPGPPGVPRWKVTALQGVCPDPQLTATYFPEPLQTRLGPQDWNVSFSQKIPFPGKLSKAGEVVRTEAQIARLRLE